MLNASELESRLDQLSLPNVSRGIVSTNTRWFLNAGVIVRTREHPGSASIEPEEVYGLTYIYTGSGIYTDNLGCEQRVRAGQVFQRLPSRRISVKPDLREKWIGIIFSFPAPIWEAMQKTVPNIPSDIAWEVGRPLELIDQILSLQALLQDGKEHSRSEATGRMQTIALGFFRLCNNVRSRNTTDVFEQTRIELSKFESGDLSIPDLALKFGIGYESFRKGFKNRFGESPAAYRNRIRLETACQFLSNTHLTVTEISERLAYTDIFVFSRQFRIVMHCSPTQYRERYGMLKEA